MNDLLIRGATVYDGTGAPRRVADVAVKDGRIAYPGPASRTLNADGVALMPGIVDLHTHYDAQVTWDAKLSPSPALGVTTAILGNCGFGIAPCPMAHRETILKNLSVVEGMDLQALLTGTRWEFETFPSTSGARAHPSLANWRARRALHHPQQRDGRGGLQQGQTHAAGTEEDAGRGARGAQVGRGGLRLVFLAQPQRLGRPPDALHDLRG
jgi:N-acyl-D-aspartate/D-glutamate deacylase